MIKAFLYKAKKQPWLFFFVNAALLFIIVLVCDKLGGKLLKHFYFKQTSGVMYRTTYSIEKTTAPLLVFGSSKANHHYTPEVFEKELGMEYYNTGRDGSHIFYHYAVLKSVLKRYTPKVIILDFTLFDIQKKQESYDRLSSLLPYYDTHPEIRPIVELKGETEKLKLLSAIYPYNSAAFTIFKGNTSGKADEEVKAKGFMPLLRTWNKPIGPAPDTIDISNADTLKVKYFEAFIKYCKAAGVKLYISFSPMYLKYEQSPLPVETVKKLAANYQVDFYNFLTDTSFTNHPQLFSDPSHLNDRGA
ncbi:MAG: hypothetical protein V4685_04260, partial [Bacteroidota bacterium]